MLQWPRSDENEAPLIMPRDKYNADGQYSEPISPRYVSREPLPYNLLGFEANTAQIVSRAQMAVIPAL